MAHPEKGWGDRQIETIMGNLLRAGVVFAAAVTLTGGVLFLARYGSTIPQYRDFHGEPAALRQVKTILRDALSGHGRALMQLGLLLLIATPVARVVFSLVAFAIQGDRLYVLLTLVVLAVLAFSLVGC